MPIKNWIGSIKSYKSLPYLPLYKTVALTLAIQNWVGFRASNSKASHLLELVQIQSVTRKETKIAIQGKSPLVNETANGLIDLILRSQRTDPLCLRLKKELSANTGQKGYLIGQNGLLFYKGRVIVSV